MGNRKDIISHVLNFVPCQPYQCINLYTRTSYITFWLKYRALPRSCKHVYLFQPFKMKTMLWLKNRIWVEFFLKQKIMSLSILVIFLPQFRRNHVHYNLLILLFLIKLFLFCYWDDYMKLFGICSWFFFHVINCFILEYEMTWII